jgi:hypothetical protein
LTILKPIALNKGDNYDDDDVSGGGGGDDDDDYSKKDGAGEQKIKQEAPVHPTTLMIRKIEQRRRT